PILLRSFSFFFPPTPTTDIYTLSLHDALPIFETLQPKELSAIGAPPPSGSVVHALLVTPLSSASSKKGDLVDAVISQPLVELNGDRKSTRLNSSHVAISYAVFCLKKKKNENRQ